MLDRILEKYDSLIDEGNYAEAEQLLLYWKDDFINKNDLKSLFMILNELIGFYRKQNEKVKCEQIIKEIEEVIETLHLRDGFGGATSYINIGTAYTSFEMYQKAIEYFEKAHQVYNSICPIDIIIESKDININSNMIKKFASLYNNMATAYAELEKYDEAMEYDELALLLNSHVKDGMIDSAITYINMANLIEKKKGLVDGDSEINKYMEQAINCLDNAKDVKPLYYKYVCEKCLSAFEYYGYFMYANKLRGTSNNSVVSRAPLKKK